MPMENGAAEPRLRIEMVLRLQREEKGPKKRGVMWRCGKQVIHAFPDSAYELSYREIMAPHLIERLE